MERDIFSFVPDVHYSFMLINGEQIDGTVDDIFTNGIEVGGCRIPQDKILYWFMS